MLKAIGGRKILFVYIILMIIVATFWYMIFTGQIKQGDWSTFVTAIVSLGLGYGTVNAAHKMADKKPVSPDGGK